MDVRRCLSRIGYGGPLEPNIETLRALQLSFLLTVPFENLDIHLGKEIVLLSENIFEKMVTMRRGGVCFERNILFHDLLTALGFRVEVLSARMVKGSSVGPEYDHMFLMVNLDHPYLLDVGNGHFCREPLHINGFDNSYSEGYFYRVGLHDNTYALYYRQAGKEWLPRFYFTLQPRLLSDFESMNIFHQSSPDSSFTRHRIVTIATEEGRVSLIDRRLILGNGSKKWNELDSEQQYQLCLRQYFGIEIPGEYMWHEFGIIDRLNFPSS
jgi:N-hydroxyarylamine O-acetyltransferase